MIEKGQRFGRLTVIYEVDPYIAPSGYKIRKFLCLCECGNKKAINGPSLSRGDSKSCGCLQKERASEVNTTHGLRSLPEYTVWGHMIQRCTNINNWAYPYYGARGITICESLINSFENFYKDMGSCPEGLTLERINNDLGYCKENCKWDTRSNQTFNQRTRSDNTSGRVGVYQDITGKQVKWNASITKNGKTSFLGSFFTFEEAVEAREIAELELYDRVKK